MKALERYLHKNTYLEQQLDSAPESTLSQVVVIPCYREDNLLMTLNALWKCKMPNTATEVIVVINSSEADGEKVREINRNTIVEAEQWMQEHQSALLRFFIIHAPDLPKKHAGAGLARKIGMDEALRRFRIVNKPHGAIVSLDADTLVEENYLLQIEKHFQKGLHSLLIYFEHPFGDHKDAIVQYELHMRYFKQALSWTGFPYAHHTVGSAFAVRADVYAKQGGMNRKQAGEDFYFLHKVFPLGKVVETNETCVYPSSRISDRVPFGTGPVIEKIENSGKEMFTYPLDAFLHLKVLFESLQATHEEKRTTIPEDFPKALKEFLQANNYRLKIQEAFQHTSNYNSFVKRFFQWMDAFRVVKYLNFLYEEGFLKKSEISTASFKLLHVLDYKKDNAASVDLEDLLIIYRKLDKAG